MAEVGGGELQTLISTLQNGNVQLGHIYQALGGTMSALNALTLQMGATATSAGGAGAGGALPDTPDGYITVNIPGVGSRLIPYYPV